MNNFRIFAVVLILVFSPVLLAAQSTTAVWDSEYEQWDLTLSLAGGLSYGFSLAAAPSVELIVSSVKIDDFLPLDFGVKIVSLITSYNTGGETVLPGWRHVGIGVSASAHLSFNNLQNHSIPFMENFDFFVAVGPVYDFITYTGAYIASQPPIPSSGIGMSMSGGARYFLLDWLSVELELFNWRFSPGVSAGVALTF